MKNRRWQNVSAYPDELYHGLVKVTWCEELWRSTQLNKWMTFQRCNGWQDPQQLQAIVQETSVSQDHFRPKSTPFLGQHGHRFRPKKATYKPLSLIGSEHQPFYGLLRCGFPWRLFSCGSCSWVKTALKLNFPWLSFSFLSCLWVNNVKTLLPLAFVLFR